MSQLTVATSKEDQERLKAAGNHIDFGELTQNYYTLRDVSRICDLAPAWVRTQLKTGKIAGYKQKKGNRNIWAVKPAEVQRVRLEQIEKQLERLDRPAGTKKYLYRRPTEWAEHLTVKAIKADKKLDANQKKAFLTAMNRYKAQWEREYQERLAKKAAKEAEEAKS